MAHFDELVVKELSLVDKAANKEKFLLYKSEDPPKPDEIMGVVLNSDLESLEKMVATVHELVNRMLGKTTKKGYEYPYPDMKPGGKMMSEEEQARKKKEEEEEQARKKKKDEEEEMAKKKKEEDEKEMAALRTQVKELQEFKKTIEDLLPGLQNQIDELSPDAILAEAKKM